MRMLRTAVALAAVAAGPLVATAAGTGVAGAQPLEPVTVCHGTASDTNPYVEVTVSPHSFKDGHFDDGTDVSHGANNHPDFLLAPGRSCADGPGGGGGGGGGAG